MNFYLLFILLVLAGDFLLDLIVEWLNLRRLDHRLPKDFVGYYDEEKYFRSQQYTRERTRFGLLHGSLATTAILAFIPLGGFNIIDHLARRLAQGPILTGLVYVLILSLMTGILSLPFSIYSTFVIEEKYGFNKTTAKTFVMDLLKGFLLMLILGGPLLAMVIWFFSVAGKSAWIIVWIAITTVQLFMTYIAPVVIMPLFNKFTPLEDGELKRAVEVYAQEQGFKMKGLFRMDGSKRSSKTNAFFTGFGRFRRIVLFDTLIEKHSVDELLAIIAHEMGHYKLRHIMKLAIASILETGFLLFLLSFFIRNPGLFAAFKMEHISIYAGLVFFGFLYTPLSSILSIVMNYFSRRHELDADRYAVQTTRKAEAFIVALKKLSVENLSNLTPHPLKVFLEYSHPPVSQRIHSIIDCHTPNIS